MSWLQRSANEQGKDDLISLIFMDCQPYVLSATCRNQRNAVINCAPRLPARHVRKGRASGDGRSASVVVVRVLLEGGDLRVDGIALCEKKIGKELENRRGASRISLRTTRGITAPVSCVGTHGG